MSDETPTPAPDPNEPPQGVVESLRGEIEDAVEHVPQPIRWTVGKLFRLVGLVLTGVLVLAVVSTVLFLMNRTELVAREITLLLNRTLKEHSDVVLDLRDIRGNPFTGFRAIEPRVRFSDGSPLLVASEMRVNYSAWGLLTGGDGSLDVVLDRPRVQLRGADGGWRLPTWHGTEAVKSSGPARALQIRLHVRGAELIAPTPCDTVRGVEFDVVANTGAETRVSLQRMRYQQGPWHSRLEELTAELVSDRKGMHVRVGTLRTGDLELRAEAGWANEDSTRHVHLTVGRIRFAWLAEVFDNKTFAVPGEGAFVVDATGATDWTGRFRTTLSWDGLPAEGEGRVVWAGGELRLDSLVAYSDAGDVRGSLRWAPSGWEITAAVEDADPSDWHLLRLDGWPAGSLNGRVRYTEDTRIKDRAVGMLEAHLGPSELMGYRVDSALVRVDLPPTKLDSFQVVGLRRGGRFTLRGGSHAKGWSGVYAIRDLPLEEWPDGRATGLTGMLDLAEGTIEDREGRLLITGDLNGRGTHWGSASFARWTLSGVDGQLLPKPDLAADVEVEDGFFTGLHLDRAHGPIVLGEQVVRFEPLTVEAGDTTAVLRGAATWTEQHWAMTLSHAELKSQQFHFVADPPVRLAGDAQGTVMERVVAEDRGAHIEAKGRWAAPGGPYDFHFTGRGLDLSRVGMDPALGLGGRAEVDLAVTGRSGAPDWRFAGRVHAPAFGGHVADSVALTLHGGAHRLELEDGLFRLGAGTLRGSMMVDRTVHAFPDSLSPTAVVRWLQDAAEWRGRATADAVPLGRFTGIVPEAKGWDGDVYGTLALSGRPADPVIEVQTQAERFGWREIRTEYVSVKAHYEDERLVVQDARARIRDVESRANLSVPLRLALGRTIVVPDEPLQGRVDIPSGDLKVLPMMVPQLQSARGRFELAATVGGTARAPRLAGKGRIRDGVVRPINRSEVIEGVYADLHFDQDRITLDTLSARQGRTGRLWARGVVNLEGALPKNYRIDLGMRNFAASEEGMYAVLFDGDFVVSDGPPLGGQPAPYVTGRARLRKGVVEFDFANQSEVQRRAATTQPLFWTYRIKADAQNNMRWRTQDADMEFDVDVDLQQTADSLLIYGEMHLLRGQYWFLGSRFRMNRADLVFDNQLGVDPNVDIVAETRLPSAPGAPLETITAQLSGRASKPVILLTSSANSDQRTILAAITRGAVTDEQDRVSVSSPLDNYVTRQLNAQLSSSLSQFFRGAIDEWELRRDRGGLLTGEGGIVVGLGSQVTNNLAFRYRQRLPMNERPVNFGRVDPTDLFDQNIEAEYRINRFIYFTSGVSRRHIGQGGPTPINTDYNVNLKARWEY